MDNKNAQTSVAISPLIASRWSPRAFDPGRPVGRDQLVSLCEAARWAPSCFGDEPWRFIVCDRTADEGAWSRLLGCLTEKNQAWAKNAPVLVAALADTLFSRNQRGNRWGEYDTGAASENLCLQAASLGLAAHQMGGFDAAGLREAFAVPERFTPMAVIAVGYRAGPEALAADSREAERAPRTRTPVGERFFKGSWGVSFA